MNTPDQFAAATAALDAALVAYHAAYEALIAVGGSAAPDSLAVRNAARAAYDDALAAYVDARDAAYAALTEAQA